MRDFFQMTQSKMVEFGLFKFDEFPRSKLVYRLIYNFRCGYLFIVPWQSNERSFTVGNVIQENLNIFSLTNHNVKTIIVITQWIIRCALHDDRLMRIDLPFVQFCASTFNGFHIGQVEKTEFSGIMDDDSENVWNEGLVKKWFWLIFLELQ